jgi:hypothetical protein
VRSFDSPQRLIWSGGCIDGGWLYHNLLNPREAFYWIATYPRAYRGVNLAGGAPAILLRDPRHAHAYDKHRRDASHLPRRWYDKRWRVPEKLHSGALRRNSTAIGISRQMANFNAPLPHPDGNQDAQRSLEIVLDNLKLFRVGAHDAFLGDETSNEASLDRLHESRAERSPTGGQAGRCDGVGD